MKKLYKIYHVGLTVRKISIQESFNQDEHFTPYSPTLFSSLK